MNMSCLLVGLRVFNLKSSTPQRFSMGLRSGDWGVHSKTLTRLSCIQLRLTIAVCFGSLSCRKSQFWPPRSLAADEIIWVWRIWTYSSLYKISLIKYNSPTPLPQKHPQTFTFSSCLTVAIIHSELYLSLGSLQTRSFHFITKVNGLSSDHRTLRQNCWFLFTCCNANAKRFSLLVSLTNGLRADQKLENPVRSCILLSIVFVEQFPNPRSWIIWLALMKRSWKTARTIRRSVCGEVSRGLPVLNFGDASPECIYCFIIRLTVNLFIPVMSAISLIVFTFNFNPMITPLSKAEQCFLFFSRWVLRVGCWPLIASLCCFLVVYVRKKSLLHIL